MNAMNRTVFLIRRVGLQRFINNLRIWILGGQRAL